jgi:hypothetical protein
VERHRIGDRPIAVKQVSLKLSLGQLQLHRNVLPRPNLA